MLKRLLVPVSVFIATFLFCLYILFESRSSTAAIGIIFIPFIAIVPAALSYFAVRTSNKILRVLLCVLILGYWGKISGAMMEQRNANAKRDQDLRESDERLKLASEELQRALAQNPGKEEGVVDQQFALNPHREKTIALLMSRFCPEHRFIEYAASDDMGFLLAMAQNDGASSKALEMIFNAKSYPGFYYSSLSRNPKTPPEILRKLYEHRSENTLIETNLFNNPNTPPDLVELLSR